MKCLTVRQPYAWAIIHGGKDVENRSRNVAGSYRGPLVIHASLTVGPEALDRRIAHAVGERSRAGDRLAWVPCFAAGPSGPDHRLAPWYGSRGGALGVATLVDVHRRSSCLDYDDENDELRPCSLWASTDEYHLVLANPRPFTVPIPYRGRLGLWEFPDELLPEVAW